MPTGKPDFNLNSFGIKYLTKDEVQEFLNKYKTPTGADQAAFATERDKKGTGEKLSETGRNLVSDVTPKLPEAKPRVTNNTGYIFNDPKYGIPDTRKPQTTGHGESGVVSPNTPALDTRISTGTAIGNKGDREGGVGNAPEELTGDDIRPSKQGNRTVSVGVGQKGKEVFDKKEGVGEKYEKQYDSKGKKISAKARKEKLESDKKSKEKREKDTKLKQALHKLEQQKQYDKKIQQKTGEGSKIETEPTIETESEESFKKRSADNERKRQADAAKKKKKLTDNERMTKIVEEHRAARVLGKSNDIITDMNILKLDLMKGIKSQKFVKPNMQSAGKNPATKPANAGGIQNKLETLQNEAPKVTPEKQAKDKKLLETGATGKPSGSVADQYT